MRKTKLRPTQKHDVIYVIANEGYLNRWRDMDQPQMKLLGSDSGQVTYHHQINYFGIHKNLFFFEIFRSQNGKRNQPFRALILDRLFIFIG